MMTTEQQQITHTVTLDNGDSITYVIRGLNEDDELEKWAAFCACIFSYKASPPPASYFKRHYQNDPTRVASLIRVAIAPGDRIVASCRLLLRTLSGGINAGGIGEVCTAKEHRRRGISKVLLTNVIAIMKERQLQVSLLHAGPAFFPVYESVGYSCSTSKWSVVPVTLSLLEKSKLKGDWIVRQASFPSDTDILCKLHKTFSEDRFAGCLVRCPEYWNEYLSVELKGSLWILEGSKSIVAWLSVRPRGDRLQLREFGHATGMSGAPTVGAAFATLFAHAFRYNADASQEKCVLSLPKFMLDKCENENLPGVHFETATCEDDLGWMYKIMDRGISINDINGTGRPHLIWPADSF